MYAPCLPKIQMKNVVHIIHKLWTVISENYVGEYLINDSWFINQVNCLLEHNISAKFTSAVIRCIVCRNNFALWETARCPPSHAMQLGNTLIISNFERGVLSSNIQQRLMFLLFEFIISQIRNLRPILTV